MDRASGCALKTVRVAWIAGARLPEDLPAAHVWVVQPRHDALARDAVGRHSRRPRIVVDGPSDAFVDAARIEGAATALSVQRALQLGADVVVSGVAHRAAAIVGAAAWYHGWKLESDRSAFAGALAAAVALRAATGGGDVVPTVEIDAAGGASAKPVDRAGVIARLLLESGAGPSLPEVACNLGTVHVLDNGESGVRLAGIRSAGGAGAPAGTRLHFRGQVHDLGPVPASRGSNVPIDIAEHTMPVGVFVLPEGSGVCAREFVRTWATDHGEHSVLVVSARRPGDYALLAEWATATRAASWFGASGVVRQGFPNLSSLRFVSSSAARRRPEDVAEAAADDEIAASDE